MPALSPTMTQGNIASWQVSEGAEATAGDIIADIETDKATLGWENQDDGFIAKLLKPSGSKDIPVGTPLVVLVEEKEHIDAFKDYKAEGAPAEAAATPQKQEASGDSTIANNCSAGLSSLVSAPQHAPAVWGVLVSHVLYTHLQTLCCRLLFTQQTCWRSPGKAALLLFMQPV